MSTARVAEPQAGVEPLFATAPDPDPLEAARAARRRQAEAKRNFAEARERYLGAWQEASIAEAAGHPRQEVLRLRQLARDLHAPVRVAREQLDAAFAKPKRSRRR